jgi:L-cystine transport system permease protein
LDFFSWERFTLGFPEIFKALNVTFGMVLSALAIALVLGIIITIIRVRRLLVFEQLFKLYVSFMRGTPVIVQMYTVYYGLPVLTRLLFNIDIGRVDKIIFVVLALGLNEASFVSEIIRSAIQSVSTDQLDASYSVGLTYLQAFRRVIAPQALKVAIPSLCTQIVVLFHSTSLAYMFGIVDVMGKAQRISGITHHQLESLLSVTIIFVLVSIVLNRLFRLINSRKEVAIGGI